MAKIDSAVAPLRLTPPPQGGPMSESIRSDVPPEETYPLFIRPHEPQKGAPLFGIVDPTPDPAA